MKRWLPFAFLLALLLTLTLYAGGLAETCQHTSWECHHQGNNYWVSCNNPNCDATDPDIIESGTISKWYDNVSRGLHNVYCDNCDNKLNPSASPEACSGGTANCNTYAECAYCDEEYGEYADRALNDSHNSSSYRTHYMNADNVDMHGYLCTRGCGYYTYVSACTYNTATCVRAYCIVCGYAKDELTSHSYTRFYGYNSTQHVYQCIDCDDLDYIDHTYAYTAYSSDYNYHYTYCTDTNCPRTFDEYCSLSTATCLSPAQCSACNGYFGSKDMDNHVMPDYGENSGRGEHTRYCVRDDVGCGYSVREECWGGSATCECAGVYRECDICGEEYGDYADHNYNYSGRTLVQKEGGSPKETHGYHCQWCDCDRHIYIMAYCYGGSAECVNSGVKATCAGCGEIYGGFSDHNFDYTGNAPVRMTSTETHAVKCEWCDLVYSTPEDCSSTVPATCNEYAVCDECGETFGDLVEHDFTGQDFVNIPGTETHGKECLNFANCGEYGEVEDCTIVPAKCVEDAYCSVCEFVFLGTQTGHVMVIDEGREPTCTRRGLTEGTHCENCDDVTVPRDYIPRIGHNVDITDEVKATCVAEGSTQGETCYYCGMVLAEVLVRPIDPLGHDFQEVVIEGTEDTETVCALCGLKLEDAAYTDVEAPIETAEGEPKQYEKAVIEDEEGGKILTITIAPEADGTYADSYLYLTLDYIEALVKLGYTEIRFVVGEYTLIIPLSEFSQDDVARAYVDFNKYKVVTEYVFAIKTAEDGVSHDAYLLGDEEKKDMLGLLDGVVLDGVEEEVPEEEVPEEEVTEEEVTDEPEATDEEGGSE